MPRADQLFENGILLRIMEYGPPKTRKTWWAGRAAEAGFNVILIDGDDGTHILKNIKEDARKHIYVVDARDDLNRSVFAPVVTKFLTGKEFIYDETERKQIILEANMKEDHSFYFLNALKLTPRDVLVIDSWTALTWSLKYRWYLENNIDVTKAEQVEDKDWDVYAWSGAIATWMLDQLKSLNCHVIVIAHQIFYEKKNKKQEVVMSRMQPVSTSGPHGQLLASKFSDIFYFYVQGSVIKIDTSPSADRDGGSRLIPPQVYNWQDLQFTDLCLKAGIELPTETIPPKAAKFFHTLSDIPEDLLADTAKAKPTSATLNAKTASGEKPKTSFGDLLKPK